MRSAAFVSAFAKGMYFNHRIRGRYAYRELNEVTDD